MNIIDRYDLNTNNANLTKLENTKRQYQNNISKFS
ncbi:flagellar biosynthesis protein FlgJ, partial [Brachyspira catarrhinii]